MGNLIKELVFVAALSSAAYAAWLAVDAITPMDTTEARKPNPNAVEPDNVPYIGIGIARTIEAFGGNPAEVLD